MTLLIAVAGCAIIACDRKSDQLEFEQFSTDETFLIDAYVEVKRAGSYYPYQAAIAESLFVGLTGSIDTLRVARVIATLNENPDRWVDIYEEIEERLREIAREKELKRSGTHTRTPAQVEKNDKDH